VVRAYFINTEDCMGNPQQYWRAEHTCSDGKLIMASGSTEHHAAENASRLAAAHEQYLKKAPMAKLKALTSGPLYPGEQPEAIRLIAQILEDYCVPRDPS